MTDDFLERESRYRRAHAQVKAIRPERWMGRSLKLDREFLSIAASKGGAA